MTHESISDERIWRVLTKAQDDLDWCRLQLTPPPRPFPLRIDPETGQFLGPTPEEVEAAYPPPTVWPARQESGPMAPERITEQRYERLEAIRAELRDLDVYSHRLPALQYEYDALMREVE